MNALRTAVLVVAIVVVALPALALAMWREAHPRPR